MNHNPKRYYSFDVRSKSELASDIDSQIRFLTLIHPNIATPGYKRSCIEIRPISSTGQTYNKSFVIWRFDEDTTLRFKNFIDSICLAPNEIYYSVYSFDYQEECLKGDGKKFAKGRINKQNSVSTCSIPMDFDNIDYYAFQVIKQQLIALGIHTVDVFTGHGFQAHILLHQEIESGDLLEEMTALFVSKGLPVDSKISDSSRLMRLPYTFNCKAYNPNNKHYESVKPEIIKCEVIHWTESRYSIDTVKSALAQLHDSTAIYTEDNPIIQHSKENLSSDHNHNNREVPCDPKELLSPLGLSINTIEPAILEMITRTPMGCRNDALLFLVPYFRNTLHLDYQQIQDVMEIWGQNCSPRLNKSYVATEVQRIYFYGYQGRFGKYTPALAKEFGYIDFSRSPSQELIINNKIFEHFPSLSGVSVKILLILHLLKKQSDQTNFTNEEICKEAQISLSTFNRNIKPLLKANLVSKKTMNRTRNQQYGYYLNPYFQTHKGYTLLTVDDVVKNLIELTPNEIKIFLYLYHILKLHQCSNISQITLSEVLNISQPTVSKITSTLHQKRFIKKEEYKSGIKHCKYSI